MNDLVNISVSGRVAILEIRRPPNNFFDETLLTALADALHALDGDAQVSCVVLCSQGRHFCAGADLRGIGEDGIRRIYRQALRLFTAAKPIVAAVQGAAVGGGLGLAMAADFRVAGPQARFTANFARLGFHQGFALSVTLPRTVGEQHAAQLLYTGRAVGAAEALAIGLCDQLADDPRAGALALAEQIASSAPLSLVAIRATLRRRVTALAEAALDEEAAAQAALLGTADFAEGLSAAAGKRSPNFVGS
ncbi:enoyl-CoA hydratase/isomerase family protein [Actinoplanes sichuanensis]|uniref:Enoyl-CoA hydratase/isomerase family protein n=1 Tax=Actinoplanes sichuanensis TaxID=512349 RepID=A0ABW4AJL1_9ACTN|nr:enoyl-CoA hydratase/isomerase family protein [Actinoplanes sichuanensis]BEL03752.1 enoyl-CoA hydratase/isomerase family protein [Actinoplanes sichuanensis]